MMSRVTAVVAAHGTLAPGLVSAVDAITGRGNLLVPVSNAGLAAAGLADELARVLDETAASIVFTDLPGGSCTLAARRLQAMREGLTIVTGVNLPVLLEFVMQDSGSIALSLEKGRDSMRIFGPSNVD